MKRPVAGEVKPSGPTKPTWQCSAWGCTLSGGLSSGGRAYCRYHHSVEVEFFDPISDVVNREAWRMRLAGCAQAAASGWRDVCRELATKYGHPELDPYVLSIGDGASRDYEQLVLADLDDAVREPIARITGKQLAGEVASRPVSPLERIASCRAALARSS